MGLPAICDCQLHPPCPQRFFAGGNGEWMARLDPSAPLLCIGVDGRCENVPCSEFVVSGKRATERTKGLVADRQRRCPPCLLHPQCRRDGMADDGKLVGVGVRRRRAASRSFTNASPFVALVGIGVALFARRVVAQRWRGAGGLISLNSPATNLCRPCDCSGWSAPAMPTL